MREIKLKENDIVIKCPKCGNNTEFKAYSQQCCEDACNVWVECKCGFDPTAESWMHRFEDVWGGTDFNNVRVALDCWNEAICDLFGEKVSV